MTKRLLTATTAITATTALTAAVLGLAPAASADQPDPVGHVYQATNAADGNAVTVFDRYADGSLHRSETVGTGGLGAGASLHSQGCLARDGRIIFAVNAGDDTVSALYATGDGLVLRDTVSSGGDFPVSLTVRNGVGFVLNQGDDTISGFAYDPAGHLHPLAGTTRSLTPNPAGGTTDAAQVAFTPDGRSLVVTEKASSNIDTFSLAGAEVGTATPHQSAGTVPYGFDFGRAGHLIVSEAATGSASSYRVNPFTTVTGAVSNGQRAACWLVTSGEFAYVVNAATRNVSAYRVGPEGALTLVAAVAATTGAGATDAAVSPDGRQLSVRQGDGSVGSWLIGADGSLTDAGSAANTAFGTAGLVAD